jgi:hypothetical protein
MKLLKIQARRSFGEAQGREFQVAKALQMDYRTVNAILRKEKLLPPEPRESDDTPLFPDNGSDPLNLPVE